jgi:hypothetical protein
MYLWAQTARVDVGLLSPLPMFEYICDQPGIRVGFFVSSYSNFCRPPDRRKRQRGFIIVWLEDRASKRLWIG